MNRGVYILSNNMLNTHGNTLSPNSAMPKALGHLR